MFHFLTTFRRGDERTFSKLYARFRKPLFRYVSLRINDVATAEEVLQDIFLKVYRFRESYDPSRAFSTWLWTIARNTVADSLRKKEIRKDDDSDCDEIPHEGHDAETALIRKADRRELLQMGKNLTHLQKRVLWLRFVHHFSYDEISKALGISLSSVKSLAYRAKASLTTAETELSGSNAG